MQTGDSGARWLCRTDIAEAGGCGYGKDAGSWTCRWLLALRVVVDSRLTSIIIGLEMSDPT